MIPKSKTEMQQDISCLDETCHQDMAKILSRYVELLKVS